MFDPLLRDKFFSSFDIKPEVISHFSGAEKFYETLQDSEHFKDIERSLRDMHQMSNLKGRKLHIEGKEKYILFKKQLPKIRLVEQEEKLEAERFWGLKRLLSMS